jgi:hypothetical protein
MRPQNTTIVVSHYDADVTWTRTLADKGFRILVYDRPLDTKGSSKSSSPYFVPQNKAQEAATYLKHIIDFYDNLSPYTVFVHDHEHSWHHKGSLVERILETRPAPYRSMNSVCLGNMHPDVNTMYKTMISFYDRFLAPYLGIDHTKIGDWTPGNACCGQFVVGRERIRQHPKKMYEDIYKYVTSKNIEANAGGYILEWTWFLILEDKRRLAKQYDPQRPGRRRVVSMGDKAKCI